MINLKRKDSVADAVKSILNQEEIDVNDRTADTLGGRKKTTQKDDVGPASDGRSTKVRFHAGPKNESVEVNEMEKVLAPDGAGIVKTEYPEPRQSEDLKAKEQRKKQGMKEAVTLKGFKERFEDHSMVDQMIAEVLSKDASAGKWIHDFVHSDNPKFAGKSKEQRKKQALAAYYAKQRNEETEQVEEGVVDTVKKVAKKVGEVLGGPDDEGHKKDLQKKMGAKPEQQHGKPSMAKQNEEVEVLDEGKMDKMSLSQLWHKHASHTYWADQGYGSGSDNPKHAHHAATAIENHVRKHHGNKVADDMVSHSEHHVAHAEYVGGSDAKKSVSDAEKLRKKHGIKGDLYGMHNESVEQIDELKKSTVKSYIKKKHDDMYKTGAPPSMSHVKKTMTNLQRAHDRNTGVKPTSEETVEEGWDDMLKDVKAKKGPQPSGGSGVKQGSRYGGGKQKDKPEHDDKKVSESKEEDVPFDPPYTKKKSDVVDKSGAHHTPMSKAKHLARFAMSKLKKDLSGKKSK